MGFRIVAKTAGDRLSVPSAIGRLGEDSARSLLRLAVSGIIPLGLFCDWPSRGIFRWVSSATGRLGEYSAGSLLRLANSGNNQAKPRRGNEARARHPRSEILIIGHVGTSLSVTFTTLGPVLVLSVASDGSSLARADDEVEPRLPSHLSVYHEFIMYYIV
eukprot:5727689-Pyramimonas_sp.AAC.3